MLSQLRRFVLALTAGALLWHSASGTASAQYYYTAPRGESVGRDANVNIVRPPGGGVGYPAGYGYYPYGGGYWNGQAAMLDAYGNLGKSIEEAGVIRQQADQAKLVTRKQTVDEVAYERANKYWYSDEKIDINSKQIEYAMNNPPVSTITNGQCLNVLLPWLDQLLSKGARGPSIPIDPQIVKSMNVASGDAGGNAGMLKEVNNLQWPTATLGPSQKKLDDMLKQATAEALKGPVPPPTISALNKQTGILAEDVKNRFYKDEVDTGDYVLGNRFVDRIRAAITALSQPNVGRVLAGQVGPTGTSVEEVVYSMASKGLTFAAAQPGQESAYVAMHRAFVNFGLAVGTPDTGFRMRVGTALVQPGK